MAEITPFDEDYVHTYRAWNALQPGRLDIDLVDEIDRTTNPLTFETPDQVRGALEGLFEHVPDDQPAVVSARLLGSLMILGVSGGKEVDYGDFMRATTGMDPVKFDEARIEQRTEQLDSNLREYGLGWDAAFRKQYNSRFVIRKEADLRATLADVSNWARNGILKEVFGAIPDVKPEPIRDDEDVWLAATGTDENGVLIYQWNMNPKVMMTAHKARELASHEGGHIAEFSFWRPAIKEGRMTPAESLVTTHTLELTGLEVVAQYTAARALLDEGSPLSIFQREDGVFHNIEVMHNAQDMVNTGHSLAASVAYATERLPLHAKSTVRDNLRLRRDNPLAKAFYASYGQALMLGQPIVEMPREQQIHVLRALIQSNFTPDEAATTIAA